MKKILFSGSLLSAILFFPLSCKKQQYKTIRDTLVIHDSATRNWRLVRLEDTIRIRNNTIIHTQDSGCKSTIKIISDRVKEYLPSNQKNEVATNFLPKELKIFIWFLGGFLIFGMVLATILLIALIKRK
jgi:hypothetical protein